MIFFMQDAIFGGGLLYKTRVENWALQLLRFMSPQQALRAFVFVDWVVNQSPLPSPLFWFLSNVALNDPRGFWSILWDFCTWIIQFSKRRALRSENEPTIFLPSRVHY